MADTEEGAKAKGIRIPLVRAVSKLHFYFARKSGSDANTSQVKVTKIEVEGNTIPTASYVFPDEATYNENGYNQNVTSQKYDNAGTDYVSNTLKLAGVENKDIKEVDNPESFIKRVISLPKNIWMLLNRQALVPTISVISVRPTKPSEAPSGIH